MGKSAQQKKKKRADDFKKVKLKVGKKKPRAQNETNASVKTQSIAIPEQLKAHGTEPTTRRKVGFSTLLSQLQHYNSTVRLGALKGIQELLNQHPELLKQNLGSLLGETSALLIDADSLVRHQAVSLLRELATRPAPTCFVPFFPIVMARLSIAMTHLDDAVRLDSLDALDILLETFPHLSNVETLLCHFMELISNRGSEVRGEKQRRLLVNPSGKMTSQQWRVKVLLRLSRFLHTILGSEEEGGAFQLDSLDVGSNVETQNALHVEWKSLCKGDQEVELFEHAGSRPSLATIFRDLGGLESLKYFVGCLIPLLLECWVEASSTEKKSSPEDLLIMKEVAESVLHLWRLAQRGIGIHSVVSYCYILATVSQTFIDWWCALLFRSVAVLTWLSGLPNQLLQLKARCPSLSALMLAAVELGLSRNEQHLLHNLDNLSHCIYDPSQGLFIALQGHIDCQWSLCRMIYRLPLLSEKLLSSFAHCCLQGPLAPGLAVSIIWIHSSSPDPHTSHWTATCACFITNYPLSLLSL
uniref:Pre-rRNA-processing protein Ipi1 N-terminal domain-containing protein n=1 Tax=Eptatretus burgeri TaxID=7764 RepID=A0A8C4WXM1_EPTBU